MNELAIQKNEIRNMGHADLVHVLNDGLVTEFSKPMFSLGGLKGKMFSNVSRKKTEKQVRRHLREGKGDFDKPSEKNRYDDPLSKIYYRENQKEYLWMDIGPRMFVGSVSVSHVFSYYLGWETKYDPLCWIDSIFACMNAVCRYFGLTEIYADRIHNERLNSLELEDFHLFNEDMSLPICTPSIIFQAYKDFPLPYAYKKIAEMKLEKERQTKKIAASNNESGRIEMDDDSIIDMTDSYRETT